MIEEASEKLENQELQQRVNHDEILDDLSSIREKAKQVWDKIGEYFNCSNIISHSADPCPWEIISRATQPLAPVNWVQGLEGSEQIN